MRLSYQEFRRLREAKPGVLLIFEEEDNYYFLDFHAVVAMLALGDEGRSGKVQVKIDLADRPARAVILKKHELAGALRTLKRLHFGIEVEIIRDGEPVPHP